MPILYNIGLGINNVHNGHPHNAIHHIGVPVRSLVNGVLGWCIELNIEEGDDIFARHKYCQHQRGDGEVNPVAEEEEECDGRGSHEALVPSLVLQNHCEAVEEAVVKGGDESRSPVGAEKDLQSPSASSRALI